MGKKKKLVFTEKQKAEGKDVLVEDDVVKMKRPHGPTESDDGCNKRQKIIAEIYEEERNPPKGKRKKLIFTEKQNGVQRDGQDAIEEKGKDMRKVNKVEDVVDRKKQKASKEVKGKDVLVKDDVLKMTRPLGQKMLDTYVFQKHMEYMWSTFTAKRIERFTFIDCLWFTNYLEPAHKQKILEWIVNKDIFSKEYTFVPLCLWGHWSLLILCHFGASLGSKEDGPCMLLLDSLRGLEPNTMEVTIRKFICDVFTNCAREGTLEDIGAIPLHTPQVPQQRNNSDCGYFTLFYMYLFILGDPSQVSRDVCPCFLKNDWFTQIDFDIFKASLSSEALSEDVKGSIEQAEENEEMAELVVHEEDGGEESHGERASSSQKSRGYTVCRDVHSLGDNKRIQVQLNGLGQPVGDGGRSLRTFLGTIARLGDKLPIDKTSWIAMPETNKDDVWDFIKRKYAISERGRDFVMKDLDQKWRSWKQRLRDKYFKFGKKASQQIVPSDPRVQVDQWKKAVALWCSTNWKRRSDINRECKKKHTLFHCTGTKSFADIREEEYVKNGNVLDRKDLFIKSRVKKDGRPVNEHCAAIIEKLQNQLMDQPPEASSQSTIANSTDIYAQVLGKDRPGRIRGLGTGPTRKTLRAEAAHQVQTQAEVENVELGKVVKELVEKVNLLMQDRNSSVDSSPSPAFVPSAASVAQMKQIEGKKVKLLDVGGAEVAIGIVISEDKERVVMGKVLGDNYYEVAVLHAIKPETPLFVKDSERKMLKDAVGSHIVWLTDYVKVDG